MYKILTYRMDEDRIPFAYGARQAYVRRAQWPTRWCLRDFRPDLERANGDWFDATEGDNADEMRLDDVIARLVRM